MDSLEDKKFESLDWISQLVEPMESELNVAVASLPDEVVFSASDIARFVRSHSAYIGLSNVLDLLIKDYCQKIEISSYKEMKAVKNCFELQVIDNPIIDFSKMEIRGGQIKLVKKVHFIEEKYLKECLGSSALNTIIVGSYFQESMPRFNEVFQILGGCDKGIKSRSLHRKKSYLYDRLDIFFKKNEWNIKDTTLANKVGFWIDDYLRSGNLSAISNLRKLKTMAVKGQPIYSMEETA